MIAIKSYFVIETDINSKEILKQVEKAGRICYKSEDRITDDSASKFVKAIITSGHEAVIEHASISVRFICDRGVTHEIVRHRVASYCQESTRYCNYSKDKFENQVTFIEPNFWDLNTDSGRKKYELWKSSMEHSEKTYFSLLENGSTPQEARSVLPNSLKTELIVTMNLREWRHFLRLRCAHASHPQMRELTIPLLEKFKELLPEVFSDITY